MLKTQTLFTNICVAWLNLSPPLPNTIRVKKESKVMIQFKNSYCKCRVGWECSFGTRQYCDICDIPLIFFVFKVDISYYSERREKRDRDRERQREKERETERETERQIERDRERDRERQKERQ